jgi:hypothetical protein
MIRALQTKDRIDDLGNRFLSSRSIQILLLIGVVGYLSFYAYVSISTELDLADRAQELYNAAAFAGGQVMNIDFHTLQPGAVLFQAVFYKIFPGIDYLGFRILGLVYFLLTILAVNILLARIRSGVKMRTHAIFLLNLSLVLVPFYVYNWSLDLTYDTMPVLLTALVFYLLLKKDSALSSFSIGILISFAALIKVTFILMFPGPRNVQEGTMGGSPGGNGPSVFGFWDILASQ